MNRFESALSLAWVKTNILLQLNKFKNSFSLPAGEVMKKCILSFSGFDEVAKIIILGYTCSLIASVPPGTPGDLFITNTSVYFYAKTITGSELKVC